MERTVRLAIFYSVVDSTAESGKETVRAPSRTGAGAKVYRATYSRVEKSEAFVKNLRNTSLNARQNETKRDNFEVAWSTAPDMSLRRLGVLRASSVR